ncbi:SAM-dependent methyltransferase [Micromonospora sp. 4G57]|uniref:SAM-dependent methyltransferase n=1 Tax=Micromonospora sicca TaxID=2202420 RepID=A0ABU5JIV0_9ACTN|nr:MULTISPECIES: SAM-dependent methyltransferase [unclassified Micromonospora]MDZ5441243.1 SAM-dependent methyltransferase [Micromonospora sp. 4G57]MDZ5492518.1 SAM-dependent methyltransferase [Micromonospora sp. 4G53]
MDRALYGPDGFFVAGAGPAAHFRTSVHASPVFAAALLAVVHQVDAALGHPARLDVVDVGAGRGELLSALGVSAGCALGSAGWALGVSGEPTRSGRSGLIPPRAGSPETPTATATARSSPSGSGIVVRPSRSDHQHKALHPPIAERLRLTAVERAPRPRDLPEEINWVDEIPDPITGLLLATEWLDNVPLDVAVQSDDGWRYLLVDPATGEESVGDPVSPVDEEWLDRWWPTTPAASGARAEIGRTRDEAWAEAVAKMDRGLALAVDYGHLRDSRPVDGTLTGYRGGRQVPPVPDGSGDVTAHVAVDSVASAGERVARCAYRLVSQREALRALGADGGRPPLSLAASDPAGYVRALAAASTVAELTDPAGLGGHWWLLQPVDVALDPLMAR